MSNYLFKAQSPDRTKTYMIPDVRNVECMSIEPSSPGSTQNIGRIAFAGSPALLDVQQSDVELLWSQITALQYVPPPIPPHYSPPHGTAAPVELH